jgi:hypothetical protein
MWVSFVSRDDARLSALVVLVAAFAALMCLLAPLAFAGPAEESYIVVLKDDVAHPANLAHRHEANRGAEITHIYGVAIKGYSAELTSRQLKAIKKDPNVDYVESDGVIRPKGQTVGTQLKRVYANLSKLHIDQNDVPADRVNADIAILDTGVYQHPDLNVVHRVICVEGGGGCVPGLPNDDGSGHGTHVAGDAAAIDNGIGMVGTAPGARIWSVKVVHRMGYAGADLVGTKLSEPYDPAVDLKEGNAQMSDAIAGINYVTAHSSEIEVANMSFACATSQWGCAHTALQEAIATSVNNGVVWVAAAGHNGDAVTGIEQVGIKTRYYPALLSDVITVSAMADYDGLPGSLSNSNNCSLEKGTQVDDRLMGVGKPSANTDFYPEGSNFGPEVDMTAPGSCVFSTWSPYPLNNQYDIPYQAEYGFMYGSSVASALVAGAAADIAAGFNPNSRADVEKIKNMLTSSGNYNWEDLRTVPFPDDPPTPSDGIKEPLLDMSNLVGGPPSATTNPATEVGTGSVKLNGWVNPNGIVTNYFFQYGYAAGNYFNSIPVPAGNLGSGTSAIAVWNNLTGLQPSTTYHYRVVAANFFGTSYGADQAFTTFPHLPVVSTGPASEVGLASVRLGGTVNPEGGATTYEFQYGKTTSYGQSAKGAASLVGGTDPVWVSNVITGLRAGTTYHYRLAATNSVGTVNGADQTFTTVEPREGDLDGNGKADLAACNEGEYTAALSNGTYLQSSTSWSNWACSPLAVLGDFSGDGRTDLIGPAANNTWAVGTSSGQGFNGAGSQTWLTGWGTSPAWDDAADLNGDNADDFVSCLSGAYSVALSDGLKLNGAGVWSNWACSPLAKLGDFTGDGKADLVGPAGGTSWAVGVSNGSTGFNAPGTQNWTSSLTNAPTWDGVGDVNGDGKDDLITCLNSEFKVSITNSTGTALAAPTTWSTWGCGPRAQIKDLNGDEKDDLLVPGAKGTWAGGISNGSSFNGPGTQNWFWGISNAPAWQGAADLDANGRADLATCNEGEYTAGLSNGAYLQSSRSWSAWACSPLAVLGDFSGDGKADLIGPGASNTWAVGVSNGQSFTGSGSQTWLSGWGTNATWDGAADLSGDNRDDFVSCLSGAYSVALSDGTKLNGAGVWSNWACSPLAVLGDFSGDGRADLAGPAGGTSWAVGVSNGTSFNGAGTQNWTTSLTNAPTWDGAGDVNGDKKEDLITCLNNEYKVSLSSGTALGSPVTWSTWSCSSRARVEDFNGDGKADLIVPGAKGTWAVGLSSGSGFNASGSQGWLWLLGTAPAWVG